MNEKTTNTSTAGPSIVSMLVVLFIALKLCGIISWSWWWVLSPIWICLCVAGGLLAVAGLMVAWGSKS